MHAIFETRTRQVNAHYLFLFLIINESSPRVDLTKRKILILPLVPGLSDGFAFRYNLGLGRALQLDPSFPQGHPEPQQLTSYFHMYALTRPL